MKSMLSMINSRKKSKKVLISGYYGFGNFGDEAILGVLIKKLNELNADIRVLSSNPELTSCLYGVKTTQSFCIPRMTLRIMQSEVLISGGGSLLQDVTSIKSLIYYLIVINLALFFRKKVIIFAQGLGPINNKFGAFLTKKTLKRCSVVTVRDRKSKLILKKWGINAELVCDPLFSLQVSPHCPSNKVGVQLRSFKTLKDSLLDKLAKQILKDFSDKEIEIFSFQDHLDLEVCKKFKKILSSLNPEMKINILNKQTSEGILEKISKLDYMIAMRFHAVLTALKYGIKTLAISYDVKVEKLAQEAQIPYVSMSGEENYEKKFDKLKGLDSSKLIEFSNSKHFNWSMIEDFIG